MTVALARLLRLDRTRPGGRYLYRCCLAFVVLVTLVAIAAPWLAPHDPNAVDLSSALAGPSRSHLLGVDADGRDTLSRLIIGARTSLLGPLGVTVLSTVAGVIIGVASAWYGGWVDSVLSRGSELLFAFPGLLLAILIVAIYGQGLLAPVVALGAAYLPYVSRLTRSLVLTEKKRPYVEACRIQGQSSLQIAMKHVLPNVAPVVLAQSTINFGYALIDLAGLSFLGLGVPPLTPDWGAMVFDGESAIQQGYPLSAFVPCIAIILTVVAFNVVGEHWADQVARRESQ
jgi:peptide/nickel transport system permease protein